jgi:hypothetical protein
MATRRAAIAWLAGAVLATLAGRAFANAASADAELEADKASFFRAVQIDDDRAVKAVLARGLDPNLHDPERGETGLIIAMRY